ncbi:dihydrodipicolinate synthase family protein [Belliella sp. DSM 111904]|uniref:Dihydrodipicolinate synthase family protein n=1 Tax=Belliella filtrata TaxID=2923435 RepID=A0ABS9UV83_9BACT|nr:dihydrodipicolinate synthase family protein [Belliella filtrata]MCH7408077.1 dihydrodipicolinate synthase family protein [Belliella filtrata]
MKSIEKKYKGVVVPMITPLTEQGNIDLEAVARIMEGFSKCNISPLVLGTTGESSSFNMAQSKEMLAVTIASKQKNQKVYAGVVNNCFDEQVAYAKTFLDQGADAIVATLPGYYVLTASQMKAHFINLADAIKGDLIIYNIKATTQMSIPISVIEVLSRHEHILGLKDSERDEERLKNCISLFQEREDFSYFCGWGAKSVDSLSLGADGIVPSTGNLVPTFYSDMMDEVAQGNWEKAMEWQKITDQVAQVYQGGKTLGQSLAALKLLMAERGSCQPFMKPPLTMLDDEMRQGVFKHWENLELKF